MHTAKHDPESRALRLFTAGRPRAAIAVLTVGICRDVCAGNLWLLRAIIHHAQKSWTTALSDIEHALTLVPLPVSGQLVLADCYWRTGRTDLAITAYEHLLQCESAPPKVYASIYRGLVQCERHDLAMECCRVAVRANPDDHAAYFAMAHCMGALGYASNYLAAVLEKAAKLAPERDVYRLSLAVQLVQCNRPTEAYQRLTELPVDALQHVTCVCAARRLMSLCEWARDAERSDRLNEQIQRLRHAADGQGAGGEIEP